ncbi:heavy metal-binding protein HIP-like isoform X2 [Saccostrea echinata]|uniref:heavy metal-binding protein HIP-like isoform X2 n=1 Tax=Saccostrea echinata TaxID=191078 RepID=UPI002A8174FD|nr:heavy metal-binding protein HIP-like isoform X2 [Saccostrea echinata]
METMLLAHLVVVSFLVNFCACLESNDNFTDINIRSKRCAPPNNAYFFARLTHNLKNHHGRVPFNQVIVNKLRRYNPSSGVFVCPNSGYYVFSWTLMTDHKEWVISDLIVGGSAKAKLIVDSDEGLESGSTTAVVYVRRGQHVFVRITGGNRNVESRGSVPSFSGWRLP